MKLWSIPLSQTKQLSSENPENIQLQKGFCMESLINHPIDKMISGAKTDQEDLERDIILIELNRQNDGRFILASSMSDENLEFLA